MRQNQNPILRCAVAEGKSGSHGGDHGESRGEPKSAPHDDSSRTELRLAEKLFSDIGRDRHAESLALIRLHHQQYPQNNAGEIHEAIQGISHRKTSQSSCQQADAEDGAQDNADNLQPSKNHNGLRRVEADVRAFVNEVENQAGDPAENVAKQAGYFFVHLRCSRRAGWWSALTCTR
jgi:hypothetical protein